MCWYSILNIASVKQINANHISDHRKTELLILIKFILLHAGLVQKKFSAENVHLHEVLQAYGGKTFRSICHRWWWWPRHTAHPQSLRLHRRSSILHLKRGHSKQRKTQSCGFRRGVLWSTQPRWGRTDTCSEGIRVYHAGADSASRDCQVTQRCAREVWGVGCVDLWPHPEEDVHNSSPSRLQWNHHVHERSWFSHHGETQECLFR